MTKSLHLTTVALPVAVSIGLAFVGCRKSTQPEGTPATSGQTPAPGAVAPAAEPPLGTPGGLRIKVMLAGTPPALPEVDRSADPNCQKFPAPAHALSVQDGAVQGAVVSLQTPTEPNSPPPTQPVVLTAKGCAFVPRVQVARAGQKLQISNADELLYNFHALLRPDPQSSDSTLLFNAMQGPGAAPFEQALTPGLVELKCMLHPWLRAFVWVSDRAVAKVTGADGVASWDNIPSSATAYEVSVWHEVLGKKTVSVMVAPAKVSEVVVTFDATNNAVAPAAPAAKGE